MQMLKEKFSMLPAIMDEESEYGLTLTLNSEASANIYNKNSSTSFTNILKTPVKLRCDEYYEATLGNVHIPADQIILTKDDGATSHIQYNLGMFVHNQLNGEWELMDGSQTKLWRYIPNINFNGLDTKSGVYKTDFMNRLFHSLRLEKASELNRNCLQLFQVILHHYSDEDHKNEESIEGCPKCDEALELSKSLAGECQITNIFKKYNPKFEDHVWFKTLSSLEIGDRYAFFDSLLRILQVDVIEYLKDVVRKYWAKEFKKVAEDGETLLNNVFQEFKDDSGMPLHSLEQFYNHQFFPPLWVSEKSPPVLGLYISFGGRMSNFLSIDKNTTYVVATCGNHPIDMFNSNPVLCPKFGKRIIDSIYI